MNTLPNSSHNSFTARKRIASWASHSDPYMVVLSEQAQFLALEVIVAYLSAFKDRSRSNAFLRSHGWAKSFLNLRKGNEEAMLHGLTTYLSRNPRQVALLLESEHILIGGNQRVSRLRSAYGFFVSRGSQYLLDMIDFYLNAVYLIEEERRYDAEKAAAQKRNRMLRMKRLVARVKASKAQRCFIEVLDATKVFLAPITKVRREFANVGLGHWRYLVAPLE